jgi:glycolate oxidase FAD binding subunit
MIDPQNFLPLVELQTPATTDEVIGVIGRAATAGMAVYPWGGGTQLAAGARPSRTGWGLSLSRLNRLVDYPVGDLTITVEAGLTIAELARRLAAQGQRLPIDIAGAEQATVGGTLATNFAGPRSYAYGTLRDYVLGLQAVDGRGVRFSGGGRVVKNAAGYDLCRLLVGSLGTLAVVTQVTLMVRPVAEATALVACHVSSGTQAERLLAELVQSDTLPVAIELLGGPAWENDALLGPLPPKSFAWLVVGFEGQRLEVEWMTARLAQKWAPPAENGAVVLYDQQAQPLWQRMVEPSTPATGNGTPWLTVEIATLPSNTVAAIEALRTIDPAVSLQARAGTGLIVATLALPEPAQTRNLLEAIVRPAVAALGGHVVVRSAPAVAALNCRDVWGPVGPAQNLWARLKEQFDPQGILNPGRM